MKFISWKRIKNQLKRLICICRISYHINAVYGLFLFKLFVKEKFNCVSPVDYEEKHIRVKSYLHQLFDKHLEQIAAESIYSLNELACTEYDGSIWIYWDNLDAMPAIVERCIESIRKYSNGIKVILVSEAAIHKYVKIEPYIIEKYYRGKISRTHFSDIIRMSLLFRYGGIWMDATIFQTRPMPQNIVDNDFFTLRLDIEEQWQVVSHGQWCVFFIECKKGNLLIRETLAMMNMYWKTHNLLFDYLWIDYLWAIVSEKVPAIKKMLDEVPKSNPQLFSLTELEYVCSEKEFRSKIGHSDTMFYKMSYKSTIGVPIKDKENRFTLFGWIMNS